MSGGLSEAPDYNRQTYSDRPVGVIFEEDPHKRPNHSKQGDPTGTVQADDLEREGRRGRVQREPSGATGARSSSSVSRDRSSLARRSAADEGSGEGRNASMSPSRAMGVRSVSIERKPGSGSGQGQTIYRGLNTLEGIGSSVSPQVNPAAIDGMSRGRTGYRPEDKASEDVGRGRNPVGSPTGARSVSANRQGRIPEE